MVPRSFSRTTDSAVDTTAVSISRKPMRPGTRNCVDSSSGLNSTRGSTASGGPTPLRCRARIAAFCSATSAPA